ncbi:hypothetical protein EB061_12240, partial [bacterium]|nr:hypothetical protein [bacterium]
MLLLISALFHRRFRAYTERVGASDLEVGGLPIQWKAGRGGRTRAVEIWVPLEAGILFRVKREGAFIRFLKAIGLRAEIQVGIPEFDDMLYVASDHPAFQRSLREDASLRKTMLELFSKGFVEIVGNGPERVKLVRHEKEGVKPFAEDTEVHALLRELKIRIDAVRIAPFHFDPWITGVVFFEVLLIAIGNYGFGSLMELQLDSSTSLLNVLEVWRLGLSATLIVVSIWGVSIWILRKSTHAPLLVTDLSFFLVLSFVFSG